MGFRSRVKAKVCQISDKIEHQELKYGEKSDGIETLIYANLTVKSRSVTITSSIEHASKGATAFLQ